MAKNFIITKEHRRFTEFANAVRKERTIGICHGDAGIGKTQSARRYAHWDTVEPFITEWGPRTEDDAKFYATANRCRTVFYTPEVLPRPKVLMHEIAHLQTRLGICIDEHQRSIGKVTGATQVIPTGGSSCSSSMRPNDWPRPHSNFSGMSTTATTWRSSSLACLASTSGFATTRSSTAVSDFRTDTGH